MGDERPTIKVQKNGPLLVKGLAVFTNSRNEQIATKPTMALCRCGASKRKPICDGTHVAIGFNDQKREPAPDSDYATADCAPPAVCGDTGAQIHIVRNGPYCVRADVQLHEHDAADMVADGHYSLCRCGRSRNKPFCDGTHWYAAFKDDEAQTIAAASRDRNKKEPRWIKVAEIDELADGEVKAVIAENRRIALSRVGDKYGAIDGICPHQGGPLADGTIDKGRLRCPWHGHPFDPFSGKSLGDDADVDSFELDVRPDGVYIKVESPAKSGWTVSHVMVETMVNWGIKHVFGMVGHSNLGLAEAIRVQEEKGKIKYIGIRHEGAAAFAASGYAKTCGKPAACMTIAGPGATNLTTGLWDAKMDRTPLLALTGQINTQFLGPGAFQEIDLSAAFDAVTDFSKVVLPGSDHPQLMSLALKSAVVNRNVAHLIFPDEVQVSEVGDVAPAYPDGWISDEAISPSRESIDEAVCRIARARRPAIIAGYGARNAMEQVIALAERLNAPILTTFKAKGQISDFHPLGCGVLGRSGTPVSSWFMSKADLLVVFGASFSQHTGIDANKPLIQVDYDRMGLAKFHPVDTPVWGEVSICADLMLRDLPERIDCLNCRAEIAEQWRAWRKEKKRRAEVQTPGKLNPAFIFDVLSQTAPENSLISLDVGNNTYSFGRYFECLDQRVILCGYLGSIGYAFPAAMGAYMAGRRPVLSVSGDGGFAQYMGEFNTAVHYGMNITHIMLNNNELAKITKEQRDGGWPVWQTGLSNPNFAEYANICGGLGIRVEENDQLEPALKKAIKYDGPSLVEIISE